MLSRYWQTQTCAVLVCVCSQCDLVVNQELTGNLSLTEAFYHVKIFHLYVSVSFGLSMKIIAQKFKTLKHLFRTVLSLNCVVNFIYFNY